MARLSLVFIVIYLCLPTPGSCQDTLQVGLNSAPPCGGWNPYDFELNPLGCFALADSDHVVCRVSAEALGMSPGDGICRVDIFAQWPDRRKNPIASFLAAGVEFMEIYGHCRTC